MSIRLDTVYTGTGQTYRETDRQTDGRTDGRTDFLKQYRAVHALHADARQNGTFLRQCLQHANDIQQ